MSRRPAIHTLLAVGVSVATIGCKTIKSTLGLSKDPKEESAKTNRNLSPGSPNRNFCLDLV